MQQLAQTFKVIDNFRELNPLRREYTRTHHLSGGHESQKRLDRSFSSAHMHRKGQARPAITRAAHTWPDQTDRAALKGEGSNSKWSDHATIEFTVRFTDTVQAERRWALPLHVLQDETVVNTLRARASTAAKGGGNAPPPLPG